LAAKRLTQVNRHRATLASRRVRLAPSHERHKLLGPITTEFFACHILFLRQGPQSILVFLGDAGSGFHAFFKVRIIGADFEPFRGFPDKDFIAFLEPVMA